MGNQYEEKNGSENNSKLFSKKSNNEIYTKDLNEDYDNQKWDDNRKYLNDEQVFQNAKEDEKLKKSLITYGNKKENNYNSDYENFDNYADKKGWVERRTYNTYNDEQVSESIFDVKTYYDEKNDEYIHIYRKQMGGDVRGNYDIYKVTRSSDEFDEDVAINFSEDTLDYQVNRLDKDGKVQLDDVAGSMWYDEMKKGVYASKDKKYLIDKDVYDNLNSNEKKQFEKLGY